MSKKNETTQTEATVVDPAVAIAADTSKNVSIRIRELSGLGKKKGEIVKLLTDAGYVTRNNTPIRFQHVRNVLITPAKKAG